MTVRPLGLAAALLAASPAAALTCAPADPLRAFREANAAPDSYVVLHGRLAFDAAAMPDGIDDVAPGGGETWLAPVPARFEGYALGLAGFTRPVRATVMLEPVCLGQFCGAIGPGDGWLLYARAGGDGTWRVTVDPCGAWAFDGLGEPALDAVAACLRGRPCGE